MSEETKTETKADKFKRLAASRVTKALEALESLKPLANKAQYESTPDDLQKVFDAVTGKLEEVEAAFKAGTPSKSGFTF